ncbi:hypothetical protein E2493_14320 [Sphingomonas parva]|uniref:EF-hand domain-containing protein n=1 Tax=Sphingomonas parva TaxID=2555898 RepID=A0A4Y8ZND7_9SPHN|nr:hypothetical protein [Sphingomonas parva]TFI57543.1 hypothetical protein E2493_14320 [Sphingomonas parva]
MAAEAEPDRPHHRWIPALLAGVLLGAVGSRVAADGPLDPDAVAFEENFTSAEKLGGDFPEFSGSSFAVSSWPVPGSTTAALSGGTAPSSEAAPATTGTVARGCQPAPADGVATPFALLDRNGDGRMSPAEFAIWKVDGVRPCRQGQKADDMPPYVGTAALNQSIESFMQRDRDDDLTVSPAEFERIRPEAGGGRAGSMRNDVAPSAGASLADGTVGET